MLIAVDIETITEPGKEVTQAEIDAWNAAYTPSKEYKKPETIEKHKQEDYQKWLNRTLLKTGRLKIVAIGLGRMHPYNFELQDLEAKVSNDPKELSDFFCNYVEHTHNAKGWLGYNVQLFDLLNICQLLDSQNADSLLKASKFGVVDPCKYPLETRYKLKDICRAFNIKSDDPELEYLDGSDVGKLWEVGNLDLLRRYCELDIIRVVKLTRALSRIYKLTG